MKSANNEMKRKEIDELKNKTTAELKKLADDSREELRQLKFDLAQGKVKNLKRISELKKVIARLLTFVRISEKL